MADMTAAAVEVELADIDRELARLLMRLGADEAPALGLAASVASRATREGDVCVRLQDFAGTHFAELGVTAPALPEWIRALRASAAVGAPGDFRPLILDDAGRLYLYRYWEYETRLAEALLARADDAPGVDEKLLRDGLGRHFPDAGDAEQKRAAATAVLRRFSVISGGPGTGKTTTVVKILALLGEQAHGRKLEIALTAPTGKAAARVQDAMNAALSGLDLDLFARESMPSEAFTLHRLLGARPDSVYYRHNRDNPLALDVLIVDEASMADLALASKLLEALPATARLVLVGDKDQLASVEAGSVLGDICRSGGYSRRFARRLAAVTGARVAEIPSHDRESSPLSDSIALLTRSYRFGAESGIGTVARLVNTGRGAEALAELQTRNADGLAWRTITPIDLEPTLAAAATEGLREYFDAVRAGAPATTLFERLAAFRVLCAHRRGLFGVGALNRMIEDALDRNGMFNKREPWYAGKPVMITRNDYNVKLFNGDVGIALPDTASPGRHKVFFAGAEGGIRAFAPARLPEHETVYAMTVHKAQGSEFANVLMILPPERSPIMTRELVYTGITRARKRVEIWGDEAAFCTAVEQRMARASALQERLWSASRNARY